MSQEILQWVAAWVVFVIAQSFFINGIKIAATGETEVMPNGELKHSPMILYPLFRYFDYHKIYPVYYINGELEKLVVRLERDFRGIMPTETTIIDRVVYLRNKENLSLLVGIAKKLEPQEIFMTLNEEHVWVSFYKKYKKYKFSKWVRMPILGCIRCMSSFWSLFTFWLPMILVFGFHRWEILLWIANVPSVTFVNTYIAQRYK